MNTPASIKAEVARESLKRKAAEELYEALVQLIAMASHTPGDGMRKAIDTGNKALRKARGEAA
jgi:hypothetical protein